MRYIEFITETTLFEYDRTKTVLATTSAIVTRAKSDTYLKSITNNKSDEEIVLTVISAAEDADPTVNKQFVVWIIKQFTKNAMKYEDLYKLEDELTIFTKTKGQHKRLEINSDINQYNWNTLAELSRKLDNTELAAPSDEAVDDVNVLYNGPLGILSVPKTKEASCILGSGTKWCTAAKKKNQFNFYNKYGSLYIWYDKKRKGKFQFHFETGQFMDSQDLPLSSVDAEYFIDQNPITSNLFKSKLDAMYEVLDQLVNFVQREADQTSPDYEDDDDDNLGEMATEANFDFLLHPFSGKELAYYFQRAPDELTMDIRRILKSDDNKEQEFIKSYVKGSPERAVKIAQSFYKGPVPALETLIAQSARSSYQYASRSLGMKPFKEGEPAIATDAFASLMYATKILKSRWVPGEDAIRQSPPSWKNYQQQLGLNGYKAIPQWDGVR